MPPEVGLEPTTPGTLVRRSNPLSYPSGPNLTTTYRLYNLDTRVLIGVSLRFEVVDRHCLEMNSICLPSIIFNWGSVYVMISFLDIAMKS